MSVIFQIIVCENTENLVFDGFTLKEYVKELEESEVIVKIIQIDGRFFKDS